MTKDAFSPERTPEMRRLLLLLLLIPSVLSAQVGTTYEFIFAGSGLYRSGSASVAWSTEQYDVGSVGSGYDKIATIRGSYDEGSIEALSGTSHASAELANNTVAVNVHYLFHEIDANADTAVAADSIFYLEPRMGKILITTDSCGMPPSTPNPLSPAPGTPVSTIPTLCATNSSHGICPDPVSYQFVIAENSGFSSIVRQSGWISQGVGTTCYTTGSALSEGRRYYWRCRATNGTAATGWSQGFDFTTPNIPPPAPSGNSPSNQAVVDVLRPTLTANGVVDPNGTPVVYFFQVSMSSTFSSLVALSGAISGGGGLVPWQVNPPLENGVTYYWRVRAYDSIAYSGWMNTRSLTIDASLAETYLRGDINVNGVAYEVGDGVMFANYFVGGLKVFGNHIGGSIAASDINADSVTLSLADLAYLVRVITNEVEPYPKTVSWAYEAVVQMRLDASTAILSVNSPVDMGAGYFVLEHSGFTIGAPRLGSQASPMSLIYSDTDGILKVLIYSLQKGAAIASGTGDILVLPLSGSGSVQLTNAELAEYFGNQIKVTFDATSIPHMFSLHQNHPNPFNAATTIFYEIPSPQHVMLEIFNILGQRVVVLVDSDQSAGIHRIEWDGTDMNGASAASGIYLYRLVAGNLAAEKKMVLIK